MLLQSGRLAVGMFQISEVEGSPFLPKTSIVQRLIAMIRFDWSGICAMASHMWSLLHRFVNSFLNGEKIIPSDTLAVSSAGRANVSPDVNDSPSVTIPVPRALTESPGSREKLVKARNKPTRKRTTSVSSRGGS